MKNYNKKLLVNQIIKSLKNEVDNWEFNSCTAENKKWGIELWITNIPILDLQIYAPTKVSFSFFDKIKIYQALSECRALKIIKIKKL